MEENKINYEEAFGEIKIILAAIEEGDISIDELSEKVKRASELMDICRQKLRSTEEDVRHILDKMAPPQDDGKEI